MFLLIVEELSSYKQLKGGVKFIQSIPKTTSGKICRRELKRLHCDDF
jgi:acyl-coenzyme A synthetase/AMP-(fatty) acid ligase